ncbi:unnamed protein product [Ranitomeya imitator]|uniref:VWFA domain-containing protein n=1 Tax=Ranitomeya imitator TaxID=111125 RepID=A0ABN9L475_9NEOB|nr:unnamed protein product [Ranitomeya imitator]
MATKKNPVPNGEEGGSSVAEHGFVKLNLTDKCTPDEECELDPVPPTEIDMDIVFILDSSRTVSSDNFLKAKDFVSTMLDHFVISPQPKAPGTGARVALVQQARPNFMPNRNVTPVKEEFGLDSYSEKNLMKRHIEEVVTQLEGPSALGYSIQWAIENIFRKAHNLRRHKVIFYSAQQQNK